MNLFNLIAKLFLDNSEYEKGLKDSEKSASSFSNKAKVAFGVAAKAVIAMVGAITTASGAIIKLTTNAISFADEIDKTSQKLGLSAESYQTWSLAAQMAGAEVSNLQMGIRQLAEFTNKLIEGNEEATLSVSKLGITVSEFSTMNTEKQLSTVVNALQGMTDQTEKARIAQEIFGSRTYMELMPLLNQEQGSVEALGKQYKELGIIISDDVVKNGATLNDEITVTKATIKSLGTTMLSDLFPAISTIMNGIQDLATGTPDAVDKIADGIFGIVDMVVDKLPDMINILGGLLVQLIQGIVNKIPDLVPPLIKVLELLLVEIIRAIPDLVGAAGDIITALISGLLQLDWMSLIVELFYAIFDIVANKIPTFIFGLIDVIFDIFTGEKALQTLGKMGLKLAEAVVNGIIMGFEASINLIVKSLNLLLKGISSMWTWLGIPEIPSIPEVSIPRVSFYKNGGMFDDILKGTGTAYAVAGESGAEIVAQGSRGTGVTNIEQFAEAMYRALQKFFGGNGMTLQVGDREFKAYILQTVNSGLKQQGRQSLNQVTRW